MQKHLIAILAVALAAATSVSAQEPPQPPCRQISESPLAAMEGSWTVEWHYRVAPGEFAISEARAEIVPELQGCCLREAFTGTLRDLPYTAISLFTAPEAGSFDRVRTDSEHGTLGRSSGEAEGESVVFLWERDLGSRVLRTRHVFSEFQETSFKVEFFMSPREGAPWELVQTAHYRRE